MEHLSGRKKLQWLEGGGEMAEVIAGIDWARSPLGPIEAWPQSLRTALSILLETGFPMYIAWGREFTQFYNDGYRPILGSTKHPTAMGGRTSDTFAEIWDVIGPMFLGVMEGRPTTLVDFMLPLDRHGFAEECYFVFSYSPIRVESGQVGGVLVTVTETTQRVLGERRLKTTQALAAETRAAHTVGEACALAERVLAMNTTDLPCAHIYLIDADRQTASLCAAGAPVPDAPAPPPRIRLDTGPFAAVTRARHGEICPITTAAGAPVDGWSTTLDVRQLVALAITHPGSDQPTGILVAGTSARLMFDDAYRDFLALVASQIGTAIAAAQALEQAEARAEALAELDRAKTAFFSNVSHEFRTPLTLMIGPTEEALASPERSLQGKELESVYRNEVRLLKLVNTLLDFSRIEAGRENARFEPTDLAALTANLASAFRSATERAGLELIVDCPALPAPVYVDREMWEKIVLNLLSNAFKFTWDGSIRVELKADEGSVELQVRDTGVGMAPDDLERVFHRFFRIDRAVGRTHEGSGIGLALVRELVSIHGGRITASSVIGEGSVFSVRMPLGAAHLPPGLVVTDDAGATPEPARSSSPTAGPRSYVEEALRWLPTDPPPTPTDPTSDPALAAARVLVADDNADMRDYLTQLLSSRFHVETVRDGAAALAAVRRQRPDLILSDVMMPSLDGFELLAALRSSEDTRTIPVILLSARAGEEARLEGLQAGADDYLVKPFTARELVARVEAQIVRIKMRSLEEAHALRLASVFSNAPVGVSILKGPEHQFEFANREYLDLIDDRQVVGKAIRDALPELEGQGIYELLDGVYRSGEPYIGRSIPVALLKRDGTRDENFFDFVYQPLFDDRRQVTGIAVVAFNVTDLTTARREAESANRAKDEFLAMLGHELRNPLAPIVTALELMRLRDVPGVERERVIIERQVRHVVSLVDDLLDVSRITRGQVQLKREPVELADIVARAVEMTGPAIEERRHELDVQVPRGLVVNADAARLAQVISNLLTNAAKYTDPGGTITVTGRCDADHAELVVADNGRGIAIETLPGVFELFSQERQEIDRSAGGLGLGLAIVRSLVLAHGGSVQAYSAGKGCGAEFTIRLPLDAQALQEVGSAAAMPAASEPPPGLRVLVVDDNADAVELLSEFLREVGHSTRIALDGASALAAIPDFHPDAVILDLGLPVMDGFEVARRIRALENGSKITLVAVTGYGREIDRQRTRGAGFDHHMVKPVDLESLNDWLVGASGQRTA